MRKIVGAVVACLAAGLLSAAPAGATQAISSFSVSPSTSQAGANPNLNFAFDMGASPTEAVDTATLEAPTGLVLLPFSVPTCSGVAFASEQCPPSSQVGVVTIHGAHEGTPNALLGTAAVYSVQPAFGAYGQLGFFLPSDGSAVSGAIRLRSASDYGARISFTGFPEGAALQALDMTIWGVPADSSHDSNRLPTGTSGCPGSATATCAAPIAASVSPIPVTESPTNCPNHAPATSLAVKTHQDPTHQATKIGSYPASTGCDQLGFEPSLVVSATSPRVRNPTALDLDLTVPQTLSQSFPAPSHLQSVYFGFFAGIELYEAELESREECSAAQAGIGSESAPDCPAGSQLGTVQVSSPMVPGSIPGGIYYGGLDPQGGYRLYLTASSFGVDLKLPMVLGYAVEEIEGEEEFLLLELEGLPQLPISELVLHFFGNQYSPLFTGVECGDYDVTAWYVPWDASLSEQLSHSTQTLSAGLNGGPCPTPATKVEVSLAPAAMLADGHAVTKATATVTEANGDPVYEDQISFSSSDPGQHIGAVTNNFDGTYSAQIVSSTTAGEATITATDLSVEPHLSGSTKLLQVSTAAPPAPAPSPQTTIVKHPPRSSSHRRASFSFSVDIAGSTTYCQLDAHPYRRCTSPTTFAGLKPGTHTFNVYATSAAGATGKPAAYTFKVRKPARKHHRGRR